MVSKMVNCLKLLPLLIVLALLAGVPAGVSGQTTARVSLSESIYTATEGTDSEVEITVEIDPTYSSDVEVELSGVDGDCADGDQLELDNSPSP